MKIEEKKLSRWVSVCLVLGIIFLIPFTVRTSHHLVIINCILLALVSVFSLIGAMLRFIENIKIYRRALQALANGEEVVIY